MANRAVNLSDIERAEIIKSLPASSRLRGKIERAGKRIAVRSAKAKGMGFQKWICEQLAFLLKIPYIQGDDESLIASRSSGVNGVDIILRGEAKKRFPYSIEAKNCENLGIADAVEQAQSNQAPNTDWMVVHKRKSFKEPIVMMGWEAFIKLFVRGS